MNSILPNINSFNSPVSYIPTGTSRRNMFTGNNTVRSSPPRGFTLLQGHIQLMAMVPHINENELSPRCKPSKEIRQFEQTEVDSVGSMKFPPITPRLMPSSVSIFKMMRVPSDHSFSPYASQLPSWHHIPSPSPRTLSDLSLPPKPAKPIAMASFGRHLPGKKRMSDSELHQHSSFPYYAQQSCHSLDHMPSKFQKSSHSLDSLPSNFQKSNHSIEHISPKFQQISHSLDNLPSKFQQNSHSLEHMSPKFKSRLEQLSPTFQAKSHGLDYRNTEFQQSSHDLEHEASTPFPRPSKNNLGARRKPKAVVLAVHDCFPSDSSVSEDDFSEMVEANRKSFLPNGVCPILRKKKPTMGVILHKAKLNSGDSSEVFDILHDLNPEEVRLFTCEYLVELLSSADWSDCHLGLETIVRLARHRPKTLLSYLGPILWYAFKHLTSAKSALCRAAIFTFKELFQQLGSALDNDLEKLIEKLILKTLAANMFIREECDKALDAMVNHCSLIKVLGAMEEVSKKANIRAAASHRIAKMTVQFVKVAGVDTCLKSTYAEKILPMLFSFMTEANNEARTSAKEALAMLMNHLQFEAAVMKHVTFDRNCSEVFKKLDKMRGRSKNRGGLLGASRVYPIGYIRR